MSSAAGWARVAAGLRLVVSAAATQTSERGASLASNLARHGVDVAASARSAAAAAGLAIPDSLQQHQKSSQSPSSSSWVNDVTTKQSGQSTPPPTSLSSSPPRVSKLSDDAKSHGFTPPHSTATSSSLSKDESATDLDSIQYADMDGVNGASPTIRVGAEEAMASSSSAALDHEELSRIRDSILETSTSASSEPMIVRKKDIVASDRETMDKIHEAGGQRPQSPMEQVTEHEQKEEEEIKDADEVSSKSLHGSENIHNEQHQLPHGSNVRLKEGRAVPSTRIGRAFGFASLGFGLAAGTAAELASRMLGGEATATASGENGQKTNQQRNSPLVSDANADRLAATLCRMRGAAMKLGQMLSIQDETLLPPPLARALDQVRQGADAMPRYQLMKQLERQLGSGWRNKLDTFEEMPFAAASIGQVHRATLPPSSVSPDMKRKVVMKVQYPGVANSIESDLSNLSMLGKMTGLAPPGLFIDEIIRVGREELKVECDYLREMKNQRKFKQLVENDAELSRERFVVPDVITELTTSQVLTTEYAPGGTIDKVANLDQDERNRIARSILRLTMKELFTWRFMQTDPNWGNFLYDMGTGTTYLIDFGAAREYGKSFVDGYLRIVWAAANRDGDALLAQSEKMNFLTGDENEVMIEAHKMSGFTVGEPFASGEPFDFRGSSISSRISRHSSAFMQHRLTPPPEEVYTLHRKLAGAYMLCIKLGAVIPCRDLLEEVMDNHVFDDVK